MRFSGGLWGAFGGLSSAQGVRGRVIISQGGSPRGRRGGCQGIRGRPRGGLGVAVVNGALPFVLGALPFVLGASPSGVRGGQRRGKGR